MVNFGTNFFGAKEVDRIQIGNVGLPGIRMRALGIVFLDVQPENANVDILQLLED